MKNYLDFEKPIAELEGKIEELRHLSGDGDFNIADEVSKLQVKAERLLRQTYLKLTAWQKVQVARHPDRPHFKDYVAGLIDDFTPIAGDRCFADDKAILAGIGRFRGYSCVVIGQEKGADTSQRVEHNFGMARPEGYRKARRLMELADRFSLPVISLVDTPGAYPGVGAEERGQAEAIAQCIDTCLCIRVPLLSAIVGEGGSGGAIAIAAGDIVIMLEHSIYSVISPEGCASILWRSAEQSQVAAEALRLTAQDLLQFGLIDKVLPEPLGGAHRDAAGTIARLGDALEEELKRLIVQDGGLLRRRRRDRFLEMGKQVTP
jgi:acetyl-CoA carboxylase carboxyl transferase subunit alpha